MREVPITFVEREVGDSKMSSDIVRESLVSITGWGAGLPGSPGPHAAAPGAPVASALGPAGGATAPPPHAGAGRLVLVALLLVPVVEISLLIAVGHLIGVWPTIALVLVETFLGAYLVKREGLHARTALRTAVNSGQMPAQQLTDAALVLVGGVLLLLPGFLTDLVGLVFLLPFTRPVTRRWLQAMVERQLLRRTGIIRGEVI